MADVRNFKPRLSSSRLFSKGSKDLDSGVVDDKVFNRMTASFEEKKFLTDEVQFEYSAPLIYQLDLLKEDIDDIHSHLSESKYTSKVQKYPVVDVTEEFFVSGETTLKGNTTIQGFTDIRGDFKVNGAAVSNLKPALDFSDSLRTKTIISSSAQISSDISGSFTSLSSSLASRIGSGGGSTDLSAVDSHIIPDTDDTYSIGASNKQFSNLYIDGTAHIDSLSADSLAKPIAPVVVTQTSLKSSTVGVNGLNTLVLNSSKALNIQGLVSAHEGQEITIMNIGSGAVTITRSTKNQARTIYGSSNITINQHEAYKFVCNTSGVWYQIS